MYQCTQELELNLGDDEQHSLVRLSIRLTAHLCDQRKIQRGT